jgi:hypothetical protein
MKQILWTTALIGIAVLICLVAGTLSRISTALGADARATAEIPPFAVVELFTSEGCSSCPPADALLAELAMKYEGAGTRVFLLSLHVDYWDRLGWKDPFGSPEHSRRQHLYATALRNNGVYTPQAVVNGTTQFVGSDRKQMLAAVERALKSQAKARITLAAASAAASDMVVIQYSVNPVPTDCLLHIALVERNLSTDVRRGENGGRKLQHDNVVRVMQTVEPKTDGRGEVELALPAGVVRGNAWVVAYAQDRKSMAIVGAAGIDLPGNKPGIAPAL